MVIVFFELSTQSICIYKVRNAVCLCKFFSKKIVYMNCWQCLLYISNCQ